MGYFENIFFQVKTALVTFLGNFRKNGLFFIYYLVTLIETEIT